MHWLYTLLLDCYKVKKTCIIILINNGLSTALLAVWKVRCYTRNNISFGSLIISTLSCYMSVAVSLPKQQRASRDTDCISGQKENDHRHRQLIMSLLSRLCKRTLMSRTIEIQKTKQQQHLSNSGFQIFYVGTILLLYIRVKFNAWLSFENKIMKSIMFILSYFICRGHYSYSFC